MARILPPRPSLEHLRNEAKAILKAHAACDADVCGTLRLLARLAKAGDKEILAEGVALQEVQFALARDYGFRNWEDLKKFVMHLTGEPDYEVDARPGALLIADTAGGHGGGNRCGRGIVMALAHSGAECDYHTVMGDSGLAFIMQTDAYATPWGKPIDKVDIGWWPLDPWGVFMRLDFLGRTAGRSLRLVQADAHRFVTHPELEYKEHLHAAVTAALREGSAPLASADCLWLITGCDDGEPPLLGSRAGIERRELRRLVEYPDSVVFVGPSAAPLSRAEADLQALSHAVALGRDRVRPAIPGCLYQTRVDGKNTGAKSFALWATLLRDDDRWGADFYHSNVIGHLSLNRKSAVLYLAAMAERHPAAARPLREAADLYEQVARASEATEARTEALDRHEARETLARQVEEIAALEAHAVGALERALEIVV